ncbi:MAG: lactate utilization protein [Eubacteriales bacterium]|nr:lactate utilization protein [Eubacteriales bacterium]
MNDIEKTIAALNRKGFHAVYVKDADEARAYVLSVVGDDEAVGVGGSMTLNETGIVDALYERGNTVYSTTLAKKLGLDADKARRDGVSADVYLSSSNAITLDGDLINIDGYGNRVTAMAYGPKKVIVVAGRNKLTKDPMTAVTRIKEIACPLNARRLGLNLPCAVTGKCNECSSPQRMCNVTMRIQYPASGKEFHVVLIDGDFGY